MNIVDSAIQRVEQTKEKYDKMAYHTYNGTTYVAIQDGERVLCSIDHSVLENAKQCFLLHKNTNVQYYYGGYKEYFINYTLEYINEYGEISNGNLDDGLCVSVSVIDGEWLYLKCSSGVIYQCKMSFINTASIRDGFQSIWNLYNELKKVETPKEMAIIVELYKKDETILQQKREIANFSYANALLENERDMYKGLLDDIRNIIN